MKRWARWRSNWRQLRDRSDVPELEAACDLLIDDGNFAEARELWRATGTHADRVDRQRRFCGRTKRTRFRLASVTADGRHRYCAAGFVPHSVFRKAAGIDRTAASVRRIAAGQDVFAALGSANPGIRVAVRHRVDCRRRPDAALEAAAAWISKPSAAFLPITLAYHRPAGQARAEGSSRSAPFRWSRSSLVDKPGPVAARAAARARRSA